MPDPKDVAQAIADDLTAIGFTVTLKTEDWHGGYVNDATTGKLPAVPVRLDLRLGRRRQLPLHRLLRLPGRQAERAVRLQERPDEHACSAGAPGADAGRGQRRSGARPRTCSRRTCRWSRIVNSTPPGAYTSKVHGFVGAGNGIEYFNSVWLQPVTRACRSRRPAPERSHPGRSPRRRDPGGRRPSEAVNPRCLGSSSAASSGRSRSSSGCPSILFLFLRLLPGDPADGHPGAARDAAADRPDPGQPGPRRAALRPVPQLPGPPPPRRLRAPASSTAARS